MRSLRRFDVGFLLLSLSLTSVAHAQERFRRGDATTNGIVDLSDAVHMLQVLFQGDGRFACEDAADADDSGRLDLSDAVFLLNYQFLGGQSLPFPGPRACGQDRTPDGLGCLAYEVAGNVAPCVTVSADVFGEEEIRVGGEHGALRLVDFEGDGILDVVVGHTYNRVTPFSIVRGRGGGEWESVVRPSTRTSINVRTLDLAVGDMNGDGFSDVVGSEDVGTSLPLLLGSPAGPSSRVEWIPVGRNTSQVAVGDIDGNGQTDVVALQYSSSQGAGEAFSVLLGEGEGAFGAPVDYPTVGYALDLELRDFDGDGALDVVTGGWSLCIHLGRGDGTFSEGLVLLAGSGSLIAGDYDGDGRPDIIGTRQIDGVFLRADERGQFVDTPLGTPARLHALEQDDFDGDGVLDLISGGDYVFLGRGDGTFDSAHSRVALGSRVATGDLDADGAVDVLGSSFTGNLILRSNRGDATFFGVGGPDASAYFRVTSARAADFDGDDILDVLVSGSEVGLQVFLGLGRTRFAPPMSFGAATRLRGPDLDVGDLDLDGSPDLVVAESGVIRSWLNLGDGTFVEAGQRSGDVDAVLLNDLNGDRDLDLVVAQLDSNGDGSIAFSAGLGDGQFGPLQPLAALTPARAMNQPVIAAGDFDGNGDTDLAVSDRGEYGFRFGSGALFILLSNGDGTFAPPVAYEPGQEPDSLAIADLDNDGRDDIAMTYKRGRSEYVIMYRGRADGGLEEAQRLFIFRRNGSCGGACGLAQSLALGDVTGDGVPDLALGRRGLGGFVFATGMGDGTFDILQAGGGGSGRWLVLADFERDGDLDVLTETGGVHLNAAR